MIRMGRMIPGATPLGIGISGAIEGMASFDDGELKVIAKALPEQEIATEIFCSLVARELALPVAPPALLIDTDGSTLLFGSIDDGYPNFAQAIRLDPNAPDAAAMDRFFAALRTWTGAPEVASFDAWIDNRDRNPSNWLWKNTNDWLLIDHGKALGCDANYPKCNKLHAFLIDAWNNDPKALSKIRRAMIGATMGFSELHAQLARDHMPPPFSSLAAQFCAMLETGLTPLAAEIGNLFPGQSMLT